MISHIEMCLSGMYVPVLLLPEQMTLRTKMALSGGLDVYPTLASA